MNAAGPILVTGPDRSGTTLLYALLASHPDISMVRRTNMWRWFDGRYGDLSVAANLERCLATMSRYRRLDVLEPDIDRLRSEFVRGEATYGRLFGLFHEHHAARHGRRRWGDKSLHTEYAADRVFEDLPDTRMIQLVRDPRDRHASVAHRYDGDQKGVAGTTGRWLASVRQGRRNLQRHPGKYLIVRYETLASEPEATARGICDFLDEPYHPAMLTLSGPLDDHDGTGNSSFGDLEPGTISTRSIGRFRTALPAREIAFVQACTGRTMAGLGYDRETVTFSGSERLAFYAHDLPITAARLAGWFATERLGGGRAVRLPEHRLRDLAGASG